MLSVVTTLGERLLLARKRAGLSQAELGGALGLKSGHSMVSQWERGEAIPTGEQFLALPALLGVSGHWLLTGHGEVRPGDVNGAITALGDIAAIVDRVRSTVSAAEVGDEIRRAEAHGDSRSQGGASGPPARRA